MFYHGEYTVLSNAELNTIRDLDALLRWRVKNGVRVGKDTTVQGKDLSNFTGKSHHNAWVSMNHLRQLGVLVTHRVSRLVSSISAISHSNVHRVRLARLKALVVISERYENYKIKYNQPPFLTAMAAAHRHGSVSATLISDWSRRGRCESAEIDDFLTIKGDRAYLTEAGVVLMSTCRTLTELLTKWEDEPATTNIEGVVHDPGNVEIFGRTMQTNDYRSPNPDDPISFVWVAVDGNKYAVVRKITSAPLAGHPRRNRRPFIRHTLQHSGLDMETCVVYYCPFFHSIDNSGGDLVDSLKVAVAQQGYKLIGHKDKLLAVWMYKDTPYWRVSCSAKPLAYPGTGSNCNTPKTDVVKFFKEHPITEDGDFTEVLLEHFSTAEDRRARLRDLLEQLGEEHCIDLGYAKWVLNTATDDQTLSDDDESE